MDKRIALLDSGTGHCKSLSTGRIIAFLSLFVVSALFTTGLHFETSNFQARIQHVPINAQQILRKCAALKVRPGPPEGFQHRAVSDRYDFGTPSTLITNARIWTGEHNGTEILFGDLLLDNGIIKAVGYVPEDLLSTTTNLTIVDAQGAWVTPGLVDLHSHVGMLSAPLLAGVIDVNSPKGPILPWLRSIDGFNTHDESIRLAMAGGITTAQVLPGSSNAIGGQAFMMKLRKTPERSPSSMILEPPHTLNGTDNGPNLTPRWRHMKQACGENLIRHGTRMDAVWSFRAAYEEARKIKAAQDKYCEDVEAGTWNSREDFPESLQWEMLVDVLRGRVKISNHCYEAVDLDNILTNEFHFPIASFHHASEAWLVPDVLKRTWGGTPAAAIFATNHRYKRESYRGSEYAARVLADNNIPVVMKSDHPVLNSRYLLYEAQQAHYFGLPYNLALASVTSVPATIAGLDHRIGFIRQGADADIVLWDSHPLHLGATSVGIWIDGIAQIPIPSKAGENAGLVDIGKCKEGQTWLNLPQVPVWDEERQKAVHWDGLPPLEPISQRKQVVFVNVKELWIKGERGIEEINLSDDQQKGQTIVAIKDGHIVCAGITSTCESVVAELETSIEFIDLHNGTISPGLMSYGSPLGLEEIAGEPSTGNGPLHDSFLADVPSILGDAGGLVRAVDALQFSTRNALTAYRAGVTSATSSLFKRTLFDGASPSFSGLSTTFRTGSRHILDKGALIQEVAALHVSIGRPHPLASKSGKKIISISEQIAILRRLLLDPGSQETLTGQWFKKASQGTIPLVIEVHSADIMASLLLLKKEVQRAHGSALRLIFAGASEAHILAEEIGEADVGVIINPARPYPGEWDQRRILPGPPLSNDTQAVTLIRNGVLVALGVPEAWAARNARFDMAWASLESHGKIDQRQAYALVTTNLDRMLGVEDVDLDLVAYDGGSVFDMSSKVAAVISSQRGMVDIL
ncbi:hypothetical protein SERLADRAFT_360423 [Serpula lacrymans var. lacrymans S7.9]|uniref:Amidohydrolase-related domain-containing protein n=1 Tax=Serpula lacrymans var. lacrymans (strain S7.9) TaxID=578457 RepID=F8NMD1_SERL9|nr:uncharacterized protein SERLADRAFT_360423 [Serpula lacrymans var. lacrymans S7.9]EGO27865.1 hypothetical protein SERLADRAFT_360423 [Serpula lacrymans var. lacrymans S7.9]